MIDIGNEDDIRNAVDIGNAVDVGTAVDMRNTVVIGNAVDVENEGAVIVENEYPIFTLIDIVMSI